MLATSSTDFRRSERIRVFTYSRTRFFCRPLRRSSHISSRPSRNLLCQSNTIVLEHVLPPLLEFRNFHVSVGVIPAFTQNLMTDLCSVPCGDVAPISVDFLTYMATRNIHFYVNLVLISRRQNFELVLNKRVCDVILTLRVKRRVILKIWSFK